MSPPRPARATRDGFGIALALGLGVLVGFGLAVPALPQGLSVRIGGFALTSVEAALLAGVLSVVLVPVGIIALYQLFALTE